MKKTEYQIEADIFGNPLDLVYLKSKPSVYIKKIINGIKEKPEFTELTSPSNDSCKYYYDQTNGTMIIISTQDKERIFIAGPEKEKAVSRLNSILENPNLELIYQPRLVEVTKKTSNLDKIIKEQKNYYEPDKIKEQKRYIETYNKKSLEYGK